MSVLDDLLSTVDQAAADSRVSDVRVGLYWTAVAGCHLGLAATPTDISCCFAEDVDGVGCLHQQTAGDLLRLLRSKHPLEVTLGLAALNSVIEPGPTPGVEFNAREVILARGRGKKVVTVGHFPFTDALREVAAKTWVLELKPTHGDVPAERAPELVPQADVIGLTACTLLNGTFESLAKLFPPRALVVMLGPSTPLSPVLFDYGVQVLGGVRVTEADTVLRYVTQGSSLHNVPGLHRMTLARER